VTLSNHSEEQMTFRHVIYVQRVDLANSDNCVCDKLFSVCMMTKLQPCMQLCGTTGARWQWTPVLTECRRNFRLTLPEHWDDINMIFRWCKTWKGYPKTCILSTLVFVRRSWSDHSLWRRWRSQRSEEGERARQAGQRKRENPVERKKQDLLYIIGVVTG
jgi:hypothetical protein